MSPLYGDPAHEVIGDIHSDKPAGVRDMANESQWEYGARSGSWRLLHALINTKREPLSLSVHRLLNGIPSLLKKLRKEITIFVDTVINGSNNGGFPKPEKGLFARQ